MSGRVFGYASVFGVVDLAGDEVVAGAFTRTLKTRQSPMPMLYQHDTTRPIGNWTELRETPRGLWVEGELAHSVQLAAEVGALIEQNMLHGLSIGFRPKRARSGRGQVKRRLHEIELVEVSIVTFPMQPLAKLYGLRVVPENETNMALTTAACRLENLTLS